MIYLYDLEHITDTKAAIRGTHYQPFDTVNGLRKSYEELSQTGIVVESLTEPKPQEGQVVKGHYVNPQTGETWYEYEDAPPTPQDNSAALSAEIEAIKAENVLLQERNASMQDDINFIFETLGA